jgi:hypothetical protein
MSDPYQEGYEACLLWLEGERHRRNSYPYGDGAFDWDDGWADATAAVAESVHGHLAFRSPGETVPQLVRRRLKVPAEAPGATMMALQRGGA